jgi:N-ethylmaleimide reductase
VTDLFSPFDLKGLSLANRIVMAPMTRTRATEDAVATDLMRQYYVQRATAGLIITECTQISEQAHGIARAPGIHRADQVAAWRRITDAVHKADGRIFNQIWHCGRVAKAGMRAGRVPVAPSSIPAPDFPAPRALGIEELPGIVESFASATRNAREAGFDGVELHGAHGYLLDEFLQSGSNERTDAYGGSVENRARLLIEVAEAAIGAWSSAHVGVRLSPSSFLFGMEDANKYETFGYAIKALNALNLAYIHLTEPTSKDLETGVQIEKVAETFRSLVSIPLIINTGFDKPKANATLDTELADLVAFGVPFIGNPDLVDRYQVDAPLNQSDPSTYYEGGAKGYTDYPTMGAEGL